MDIVLDTLFIVVAVVILLAVNFIGYAIVASKMLTVNTRITKATWIFSSALVTLAPFFIPIQVRTLEQMRSMQFGFPAYFIEQHFAATSLDRVFPFYTTLANGFGYSLRTTISINPLAYVVDVFLFYLICMLVFRTLRRIMRRTDNGSGVWPA